MDVSGIQSFHLVGHDWGAAVAWLLASTAPERIRTLTAISVPQRGRALSKALRDPDTDQRSRSSYMFVFADLERPCRCCSKMTRSGFARSSSAAG